MPVWLISLITGLSLITAFKCPKCQEFNHPKSPELGHVIEAIRYTPVATDSLLVMKIRHAKEYYRPIYNDIVKCSGLQDDLAYEELEFYIADVPSINVNGIASSAYYESDSHSVVFTLPSVWDRKTIGHELLHVLLQKYGLQDPNNQTEDQHPGYWFNDSRKCKGFVYPH
jgi:hypothetical protein